MSHGNGTELLRRARHSDARFLIVRGGGDFPFKELKADTAAGSHVIAVLAWDSDVLLDTVHRILVDYGRGSRLLADHLWAEGHRHLLLAGPANMIALAGGWDGTGECQPQLMRPGTGFAGMWKDLGGTLAALPSAHVEGGRGYWDSQKLLNRLDGLPVPTAVVGLRDVDAWDVREALRRHHPQALEHLTFVGDGDTPWSQLSHPPFTSLDWNLAGIADLACGVIDQIERGTVFSRPVVELVSPRLVCRP